MRNKQILDGIWDFAFCGAEKPEAGMKLAEVAPVPGCFDVMEPYCAKRGWAIYRRNVQTAGNCRLSIDGLGMQGEVYWDGTLIGKCDDVYQPEDIFFDAGADGCHQLAILVNNDYNQQFRPFYDFYGYGGIYGSVTLEQVPANAISAVLISTEDYSTGLIRVRAEMLQSADGTAKLYFDGVQTPFEAAFEDGKLDCQVNVPNFRLWCPTSPNLHSLKLCMGQDEVTETFGIRTFSTCGKKILLNGEPIKLFGYNRHESHPELGAAVPPNLMASDLRLLKSQGCNFIRGSHYPQRKSLLELCDRMGIMLWEESIGWGIRGELLHNDEFIELQKKLVRKLTRSSFNHPCIVIRAFLNETEAEHQDTPNIIQTLYNEIRSIDEHCLISFSSNRYQRDICTGIVDVVAMNPYYGWYDSEYGKTSTLDNIDPMFEALKKSIPADKPLLITETGADAFFGFRDPMKTYYSEEYQAEYLCKWYRRAMEDDEVAGLCIWMFADTRSYITGPLIYGRARGFNNKGAVDEYRRPKLAWYRLCELNKR